MCDAVLQLQRSVAEEIHFEFSVVQPCNNVMLHLLTLQGDQAHRYLLVLFLSFNGSTVSLS
jgi:hypothetical protein